MCFRGLGECDAERGSALHDGAGEGMFRLGFKRRRRTQQVADCGRQRRVELVNSGGGDDLSERWLAEGEGACFIDGDDVHLRGAFQMRAALD